MNGRTGTKVKVAIIVDCCLGAEWQPVFAGLHLTTKGQQTEITGTLIDQAALFGLLKHIRDRNLTLKYLWVEG